MIRMLGRLPLRNCWITPLRLLKWRAPLPLMPSVWGAHTMLQISGNAWEKNVDCLEVMKPKRGVMYVGYPDGVVDATPFLLAGLKLTGMKGYEFGCVPAPPSMPVFIALAAIWSLGLPAISRNMPMEPSSALDSYGTKTRSPCLAMSGRVLM